MREHGGQPRVVGGRRREPDEVEPRLQRRQAQLLVLLRRQIDDDEPVDAGRLRLGEERLDAVHVDRVVIAHQHDRRRVVAFAEVAHESQRLVQRLAAFERAQARRPGSPGRPPSGR